MQLNLKQLASHLKNKLANIYLLHGDEPLLVQEARMTICQKAHDAGFLQRERLPIDSGFDWSRFTCLSQNYGLFSDKSIIEIINPNTKFDKQGAEALLNYTHHINDTIIIVIAMGKLTAAQQKTRWFKAISQVGVVIPIWPIKSQELPNWIQARLQQKKISADANSIRLLASLTEGNLLATQQAIEKIKLLFPNESIQQHHILLAIGDSARYNVFDFVNYILQGDCQKITRVLNRLRQEGVEATLILWALTREIRTLIQYMTRLQQGETLNQILQKEWYHRKDLLRFALPRYQIEQLNQGLQQAAQIDQTIKGLQVGHVWNQLQTLSFTLAGKPIFKSSIDYA